MGVHADPRPATSQWKAKSPDGGSSPACSRRVVTGLDRLSFVADREPRLLAPSGPAVSRTSGRADASAGPKPTASQMRFLGPQWDRLPSNLRLAGQGEWGEGGNGCSGVSDRRAVPMCST